MVICRSVVTESLIIAAKSKPVIGSSIAVALLIPIRFSGCLVNITALPKWLLSFHNFTKTNYCLVKQCLIQIVFLWLWSFDMMYFSIIQIIVHGYIWLRVTVGSVITIIHEDSSVVYFNFVELKKHCKHMIWHLLDLCARWVLAVWISLRSTMWNNRLDVWE